MTESKEMKAIKSKEKAEEKQSNFIIPKPYCEGKKLYLKGYSRLKDNQWQLI